MDKKKIAKNIKYFLHFLPDRAYIQIYYFLKLKKICNFKNPITFNEKIQWLKLNDRKKYYTMMVDKYLVKDYISDLIGDEYIIPTLGVWGNFDDINFEKLPNKFVLKCNHDSEGIVIVKDKSSFNYSTTKEKLNKSLCKNFYYIGREWPYKDVKPKIIAEEYMEDEKLHELRDYKFFCFNGQVKFFKVDFDRQNNHRANYYDLNGNLLACGEEMCPPDFSKKITLPLNLKKMIELAEVISDKMSFLRVDFYEVNGKVYFGETTFYPASGFGKFINEETDYEWGQMLKL